MSLVDLMSVMNILPEEQPSRPDYAEKRLAMAMIRDVIGELEDIAAGKEHYRMPKKQQVMQDTVAWIKGETPNVTVTFVVVCEILGWAPDYVGPELLKVAVGGKPKIKNLHLERGVMARQIGVWTRMKGGKVVPRHGKPGRPAKATQEEGQIGWT